MESPPFRHLDFLLQLKNEVARKYWPDFARKDLFAPMAYYTHQGTYVLEPNRHIMGLAGFPDTALFRREIPVIEMPKAFMDTLNFRFDNS